MDYIYRSMQIMNKYAKGASQVSSPTIKSNASIVNPHEASQSIAEMSEGKSFVMSLTDEGQNSYVKQTTLTTDQQASFILSQTTVGNTSEVGSVGVKDSLRYRTMGDLGQKGLGMNMMTQTSYLSSRSTQLSDN